MHQPAPSFDSIHPRFGSLPSQLEDFRDYHAGETILVCGCGSSLSSVVSPERFLSIGVNDVGRLFSPDYLVVLNRREQFRGDRFRYVRETRARAVFTQLNLDIEHPHIVRIQLGSFAGVDFADPASLHYTRNSPYLALCLAIHMGARRIGLIGVDFTNHHFFGTTGKHPLAREFERIDSEYKALHDACLVRGVEILNLSRESRLTAFPKISPEVFARLAVTPGPRQVRHKVFFVNYRFLTCGDVFREGLIEAAHDLGVTHDAAYWDDPGLPAKIRDLSPDLLFVVHGRNFCRRWRNAFKDIRSALWLLDEPYEVDDTSSLSELFDTTFVNDPATLHRHRNAHYLPVCYNPERHFYRPGVDRNRAVGFVGGYSPVREQILSQLANRNLLSYVVGGPWRNSALRALTLFSRTSPVQTADLYRDTKIVLNVFRSEHHFNRQSINATSLNPRVYEAAACGALVVSEYRSEITTVCPQLPTFETSEEAVSLLNQLLHDPERYDSARRYCIRQLSRHSYAERLNTVLKITLPQTEVPNDVDHAR